MSWPSSSSSRRARLSSTNVGACRSTGWNAVGTGTIRSRSGAGFIGKPVGLADSLGGCRLKAGPSQTPRADFVFIPRECVCGTPKDRCGWVGLLPVDAQPANEADHCYRCEGGGSPSGPDPCWNRSDDWRCWQGADVACHPCQSSYGGSASLRFAIYYSEDGGRRNPPSGSGPWRSAVPPRRIGIRGAKPGGHGQFTRVMVGNDSMAACFCSASKCK